MYWVFQLQDIHWWNWMPVHFQILRWIFQLFQSQVQNKNSLLLKINCKVISFMTVSNFMVCWCCNHIIPWLYEKEYTSTHEYADPSCTSAACAWNKSTKKEIEPYRVSNMMVRKHKVLMIRMLRLWTRFLALQDLYLKFPEICIILSAHLDKVLWPVVLLYHPEDNRKNTTGFRIFSEGVGWKQLPEMGQSLRGFMEYRDFFGWRHWTMQTDLQVSCRFVWIFLRRLLFLTFYASCK